MSELYPGRDLVLAAHLLALQLRSYAIEAELIGDNRIPALRKTVEDIASSALSWLRPRPVRTARLRVDWRRGSSA